MKRRFGASSRLLSLVTVALVALGATLAHAQGAGQAPPAANTLVQPSVAVVALSAGGHATALVKLQLVPGWHINANPPALDYNIPTVISLSPAFGVSAGKPAYPKGNPKKFAFEDKPLLVYDGTVEIPLPLAATASAANGVHTLHGKVDYQACNDQVCLAPTSVPFTIEVTVSGGVAGGATDAHTGATTTPDSARAPPTGAATADTASHAPAPGAGFTTSPPDGGAPVTANAATQKLQDALARGGVWLYLTLFVFGLLLNLTPCVFPMLGITVSIFGARRKEPLPKVLGAAVAYVLGICVMYSALGVIAALTGGLFGSALQNPLVNVGLGVLLVGLSLSMFGFYELQAPSWVLDKVGGANTASVLGIFFSGLAVGVIAAPCVGPFVVAVLALIAQRGDVAFGLRVMFTLSLGLGFPYLFLAAFSSLLQSLPRSGEWMVWVKKAFGVLLAGLGFYYGLIGFAPRAAAWVMPAALVLGGLYLGFMEKSADGKRGFWLFKRSSGAMSVIMGILFTFQTLTAASHALVFQPYDERAVQKSLAGGRGVVLDFSADWCVACHELELRTFPDARVIAAAKPFDAYRVDLTHYQSAEAEHWREQYAIAGLPTVVFLKPDGHEARDARVEGFVPPAEFVKRLQSAMPQ